MALGFNYILFLLAVIILSFKNEAKAEYVRSCYLTNWSQFRLGDGQFLPDNYEPGVCTHLFYAFVNMNKDFSIVPGQWNDEDGTDFVGNYQKINELKFKQPDLKTILTFGGVDISADKANLLHTMASSSSNRAKFIQSSIQYLRKYNFDGFCLNWMYPRRVDKNYFSLLAKQMRSAFEEEAKMSQKSRLLLITIAPGKGKAITDSFDGSVITSEFDYVCLDTYNYHGPPENQTGFNSPLYDYHNDSWSISYAANYWEAIGVPKSKLLIGLATFARGWTLDPETKHVGVGAPAIGPSPRQNFTIAPGVAAYYELCELVEQEHWQEEYDEAQKTAYVYKKSANETVWIGYDNQKSFSAKLDWIKHNGYGGVHVWALDMDDFRARCKSSNGKKYPLLNLIKKKLLAQIDMKSANLTENATLSSNISSNRTISLCSNGTVVEHIMLLCNLSETRIQPTNSGIIMICQPNLSYLCVIYMIAIASLYTISKMP